MPTRLVLWENSFQTIGDAQAILEDRVDCDGFGAQTDERQESALIQSYHALKNMLFIDPSLSSTEPFVLTELTSDERDRLSTNFLYALRSAQVLHADSLFGGDTSVEAGAVISKRKAGVLEERVGETFQRYERYGRLGSEIVTSSQVDSRALSALTGWMVRSIQIARA